MSHDRDRYAGLTSTDHAIVSYEEINHPSNEFQDILHSLDTDQFPIHIDLSYCKLSYHSLKLLIQRLISNRSVQALILKGNNVGDKGATLISSLLKRNRTIRRINLSRNQISSKGAMQLAAALSMNPQIVHLDLSFNGIGESGMKALGDYISVHQCRLRWLNVKHNAIGDDGANRFAKALAENQSLLYVNLGCNQIGSKGVRPLCQVLTVNRTLGMMDISHNDLGPRGAAHIAGAMSRITLHTLILTNTGIGDDGAVALLQDLPKSPLLECLDIRENDISNAVLESWRTITGKNTKLKMLISDATIRDHKTY